MEKHYILNNVMKLLQVIDCAAKKKMEALILSIDFEKCFDMIVHNAIRGSFKYFGFGETYIDWIMVLFTNFEVCTQNNGTSLSG